MMPFTFVLFCVQACSFQNAFGSTYESAPVTALPFETMVETPVLTNISPVEVTNWSQAVPYATWTGLCGRPLHVENYGGVGVGNLAVAGELPVAGTTSLSGHIPVIGSVQYSGPINAAGSVTISGHCSCNWDPMAYRNVHC